MVVKTPRGGYDGHGVRVVEHAEQARAVLGEQAYQEAFDRGHAMTFPHAIDYALEVKRHARPRTDDNVHPMPLTRRERQIAALVAQGGVYARLAALQFAA